MQHCTTPASLETVDMIDALSKLVTVQLGSSLCFSSTGDAVRCLATVAVLHSKAEYECCSAPGAFCLLMQACLPSALAWAPHPGTWALLLVTWVGREGRIKDHQEGRHLEGPPTMQTRMEVPEALVGRCKAGHGLGFCVLRMGTMHATAAVPLPQQSATGLKRIVFMSFDWPTAVLGDPVCEASS
jgi:hypothetical protein